MTNINEKIEGSLGSSKMLPKLPFLIRCKYVLFPSNGEDLIDKKLYEILFTSNQELGNKKFVAKSCLDVKGKDASIIEQKEIDWPAFEAFQNIALVYEGFYITSENFDWLGIYHQNGYTIIGSNDKFTNLVTKKMYGEKDWKNIFENAFNEGLLDIYESDFEELKTNLLVG